MYRQLWVASAVTLSLAFVSESPAAIMYSTPGSTYTQDFNSLPNTPQNVSLGATPAGWTNDNAAPAAGNFSIVGWHLFHPLVLAEGGFNGNQRMRIGAGTANTGAFMSFGASASTERALGAVISNTLSAADAENYYGARITNNTGDMLSSFTLSYTGEQWRMGGAASPATASLQQSITFDYSLNATSIQDALATFTDVPLLDFAGPIFGPTAATALDGNLAVNRTAKGPVTVTGLNWQPGTDLWIRWADKNDANNDHGLGIDDLGFSAEIPEPSTLALLFLCAMGLVAARRRS